MQYRGYEAIVEYSEEDQTFIGRVINTHDILIFDGSSATEAESSFHAVVDDYIEDCIGDVRLNRQG